MTEHSFSRTLDDHPGRSPEHAYRRQCARLRSQGPITLRETDALPCTVLSSSMNCGQRSQMRRRLRAYLPVRDAREAGRPGRRFRRNHSAEHMPHARQVPQRLSGRSLTFLPYRSRHLMQPGRWVAAYWESRWMARREVMNRPRESLRLPRRSARCYQPGWRGELS